MNEKNAKTRNKLKNIGTIKEFQRVVENAVLNEDEKAILDLHYKQGKPLNYVADILGMSEPTIKRKHKKLLMKLGDLF